VGHGKGVHIAGTRLQREHRDEITHRVPEKPRRKNQGEPRRQKASKTKNSGPEEHAEKTAEKPQ